MLISTNKVQPKVNHRFDKFLEEEKDKKGEPTGSIISSIPKDVFTTSQERVKNRPARVLPHNFPGVHIVRQERPGLVFMKSSDLEDMRRKAENEKRKALMVKKAASKSFEETKKPARRGRPKKT